MDVYVSICGPLAPLTLCVHSTSQDLPQNKPVCHTKGKEVFTVIVFPHAFAVLVTYFARAVHVSGSSISSHVCLPPDISCYTCLPCILIGQIPSPMDSPIYTPCLCSGRTVLLNWDLPAPFAGWMPLIMCYWDRLEAPGNSPRSLFGTGQGLLTHSELAADILPGSLGSLSAAWLFCLLNNIFVYILPLRVYQSWLFILRFCSLCLWDLSPIPKPMYACLFSSLLPTSRVACPTDFSPTPPLCERGSAPGLFTKSFSSERGISWSWSAHLSDHLEAFLFPQVYLLMFTNRHGHAHRWTNLLLHRLFQFVLEVRSSLV